MISTDTEQIILIEEIFEKNLIFVNRILKHIFAKMFN